MCIRDRDNPSVQDADPDETPVTPENPQNPAVQATTPDAAALPQTGTTSWKMCIRDSHR